MIRAAISCVLFALVAACSTTPPSNPTPPPPPAPPKVAAAPPPAPPPAKAAPVAEESPVQAFERLRAGLANKSVYFAFDKDTIVPAEEDVIAEHAKLAVDTARDHIVLQGNCDERGGREYNLALGQKRAEAVKSRMEVLGVPAARIETTSFGKEKPRLACHEERCWSQNRRVDFVESWR
jgi:peptidoglycan-associated lipoprotein